MRTGIVTNLNGRGLEKDARLLEGFLVSLGHEVTLLQYDKPQSERFDVLFFLEVVVPEIVGLSSRPPWLIVNPEFLKPSQIESVRRHFGKVCCKTKEAFRVCSSLFGEMAVFTGFLAEDRYDAAIPRGRTFLHVAGQSQVKGTEAVVDAWRWTKDGKALDAQLIVVSDWFDKPVPDGVVVLKNLADDELKRLQNVCLFHLQPSGTEGYGHVLHEALSVNAVVVTTDVPPMNELESVYFIPSVSKSPFNLAEIHDVSALDVYGAVKDCLKYGATGFSRTMKPRQEFLRKNEEFKEAFAAQLASLDTTTRTGARMSSTLRIAFLGNFDALESTECLIYDALTRGLGHDVERIQENRATLSQIELAAGQSNVFLWVRTPGWLQVADSDMEHLLSWMMNHDIPSVSVHLDKFWGLPEREALIGMIPFWKTQYAFTADGSRQEDFKARGVNHFYMRPAMSELYLHPGRVKDEYLCDVGFVGAKEYHDAAYPFRKELVEFLEKTYGPRFKHITGIRGHELNDFYASCAVVVGDCIFSGLPNYFSDRMVETPGRYGFLLSPKIEGLEIPFATYKPQDLDDLQWQINYWLVHEQERRGKIQTCAEYVREHDTWTKRMQWILETVLT